MRSLIGFLVTLAAFALLATACSSTTVVSRVDREGTGAPQDNTELAADESTVDASPEVAVDEDDSSEDDGPLSPRQQEEEDLVAAPTAEQLGGLLDDCEAGNDMACDILFELSPFDSPEEASASLCGGRSENPVIFCTEGIDSTENELVFDPDSEALDGIVTSCRSGDFTACDFLYFRSPFDSEFEEVGATCGDRVQVAFPDCRTFLAE